MEEILLEDHLSLTRIDPVGYRVLVPGARVHLDQWMLENSVSASCVYLITYDAREETAYVHSREVDGGGRFKLDRKHEAIAAPVKEIYSTVCPWV